MALLPILHFPDPRLRNRSQPVGRVDDNIRRLIDNMLETMYDAPGIGLAAPQVNELRRVIVVDVSDDRTQPLALINPEVITQSEMGEMDEGCLSVPAVHEKVQRAHRITVKALDRYGTPLEFEATDLLAVCIQHEIDHLEGKLFVDYLSNLKKIRITKKMEKLRRRNM